MWNAEIQAISRNDVRVHGPSSFALGARTEPEDTEGVGFLCFQERGTSLSVAALAFGVTMLFTILRLYWRYFVR